MNALDRAEAAAWARVPELVDRWVEKCAAPAWDIRQAIGRIFTRGDFGVYWDPEFDKAGLLFRQSPRHDVSHDKYAQDLALMRAAVIRAVGQDHFMAAPLEDRYVASGRMVKVAYSPTLRRLGELLNFFPGEYPGGYPNSPNPLAATLTGGLVGAGLGYGAGVLAEQVMPHSWERGKLRKSLAMVGGGLGAAPGALWAASNAGAGNPLNQPLHDPPGTPEHLDVPDLAHVPLGSDYTKAAADFVKRAYSPRSHVVVDDPGDDDPIAVDMDSMGHTLWEIGADPRTTATTMGALYAASQMPDPNAQQGQITPHQTGLLGTMMAAAGGGTKGYATGWLVGQTLGLLTGMPPATQNVLKNTGAVLGILDAVVPKLFS
jgi:hypothetical protein